MISCELLSSGYFCWFRSHKQLDANFIAVTYRVILNNYFIL